MAGKRNVEKKKKNTKLKVKPGKKKEVPVAPRLRLEPRLTPSPPKKKRGKQDHVHESGKSSICLGENVLEGCLFEEERPPKKKRIKQVHSHESGKSSICLGENVLEGSMSEEEAYSEGNSNVMSSCDEQQRNTVLNALSFSAVQESRTYDTANPETQSSAKYTETQENDFYEKLSGRSNNSKKSGHVYKGFDWSDREWMDLAISLQAHGFSDLKKIADCVKTKSENDIRQCVKNRRQAAIYDLLKNTKKWHNQGNQWNTLRPEFIETWPNIRKWRKMAYEQMLLYTRNRDYSKPVISALCKKFYEEEKEPADPQVVNVKLIYKYMMSCMSGNVPPQLPPKESALVLDLLREVRLMPIAYDFEEERKFLQDFRSATKFKPFQVKDEFRKRYKKETDDTFSPNTIAVPEDVFLDLSRHKKLTQSFSPLVTPVWMLHKEQEVLEKYAAESNVYVD